MPWEPFKDEYPELKLPRYEAFGGLYPYAQLGAYQPFGGYPTLELPRYETYGKAYPELGQLYPEAGEAIARLLRGEGVGLPVEELMEAYTAEEKRALEEYLPQLREAWAERGGMGFLLGGGLRRGEREAVAEAAEKRATYRAGLEKESAVMQQQGVIQGLSLAMQHVGMGYEAQTGAWQAANTEYQREYTSALQAGLSEGEASERAWAAANQEYVRQFTSGVEATRFAQEINERAYNTSLSEYRKVYDAAIAAGKDEYTAQTQAWEAARTEYARVQQMAFEEFMFNLKADLERELLAMQLSAQQVQSIWGSIGTIIGGALGGPLGGALGTWIGSQFG